MITTGRRITCLFANGCSHDTKLAGVGFVFSAEDPYCGMDLDDSVDESTGQLEPEDDRQGAFLMELDPPYCDVIVDRYQRFTGKPAILEHTGQSPIPMKPREEHMR